MGTVQMREESDGVIFQDDAEKFTVGQWDVDPLFKPSP